MTTQGRPVALCVDMDGIPDELKAIPHWVVWRYVPDGDGDWDKPPLCVRGGPASSTDPATWATFADALAAYRAGGLDGIGFCLHQGEADPGPRVVGVDLDKCRDPRTGEVAEWARAVLGALLTYTEVSPSGMGLRLFARGRLPPSGRKKGPVEMYERARYVTVTGQRLQGRPRAVRVLPDELTALHGRFWPPVTEAQRSLPAGGGMPAATGDAELVSLAQAAANGAKFRALWGGDWSAYGSQSEADLALCNELAFWCGPDEQRISSLFAQSGLFRSKWQREDYRRLTIGKALAGRTEFYAEPGRPLGRLLLLDPERPDPPIAPGEVIIVRASEVEPRQVEWLWPDRLPLGKLVTFAGLGGLGKTFVLLDIAARITRGAEWPCCHGARAPLGQVLFLSGEDDPEDTLVPRLIEMGADLRRVSFLRMDRLDRWQMRDLATLETAIGQIGFEVKMVVLDPPTSFLGDVDDHKNAELRALLTPLKSWTAKHRVLTTLNTHLNKQSSKVEAMARVMGSVAWVNAVRAAHLFTRDPNARDRVWFVPMKNNVGKPVNGLVYRIVPKGLCAHVEWLGEIDLDANEAISQERGPTRAVVAKEWLIERFLEKKEWPSDELFQLGKEEGVSRNAIFEAEKILHLPRPRKQTRMDGSSVWVWWVPDNWEPRNGSP